MSISVRECSREGGSEEKRERGRDTVGRVTSLPFESQKTEERGSIEEEEERARYTLVMR